jgi:ubiquinone/menaquinone biosynthesis C-methylase UbiE
MMQFIKTPNKVEKYKSKTLSIFDPTNSTNRDDIVIESFGEEWTKFDSFGEEEIQGIGDVYFDLLKKENIDLKSCTAMDVGCGTGRWSYYLSKYVNHIEAVDPSKAVYSAINLLDNVDNVRVTKCDIENIPFEKKSFDVVYSLGVLHHIPDTQQAMKDAVDYVKDKGYFLVYLYYALDNRGFIFRSIFALSDIIRKVISKMPSALKKFICDIIAIIVYAPIVYTTRFIATIFPNSSFWKKIPLSAYAEKFISLQILRNDALDRFGTTLEQRFTKQQINEMMSNSGLTEIKFYEGNVYWIAIGKKV